MGDDVWHMTKKKYNTNEPNRKKANQQQYQLKAKHKKKSGEIENMVEIRLPAPYQNWTSATILLAGNFLTHPCPAALNYSIIDLQHAGGTDSVHRFESIGWIRGPDHKIKLSTFVMIDCVAKRTKIATARGRGEKKKKSAAIAKPRSA